ncbi:MAG: alpha/beta hydrolase [Clostridia bacterium]
MKNNKFASKNENIDNENIKNIDTDHTNNADTVNDTCDTKNEAEIVKDTCNISNETDNVKDTSDRDNVKAKKVKKPKKPIYKRPWVYVIAVVLICVLGVAISLPFSYEVQAFIIRIVCSDKTPSTPNNYDEILSKTEKIADNVGYNSVYSNGVLDVIAPKGNTSNLPLVVYIHGGYYAGGDKLQKEPYCRMIANEGYVVANINYVLTPKEQYPAQLIQANEALTYLTSKATDYHIDTNKIFIGGDSAGGHLSGILGAFYTNDTLATKIGVSRAIQSNQLKGVLLLCGLYDMMSLRATKFPLINDAMWMLTGDRKYEQYSRVDELNTVNNVTEDYPNTYIVCGDNDQFFSQNQAMVAALKSKNIDTTDYLAVSQNKKLKHEFQHDFSLQEAYTAFDMLKSFLTKHCA